jgi:hypothetical protein
VQGHKEKCRSYRDNSRAPEDSAWIEPPEPVARLGQAFAPDAGAVRRQYE